MRVRCRVRMKVLEDIDAALADIYKFNNELMAFDKTLTEMDTWINGKAQVSQSGPWDRAESRGV
jgi:hypothetical protein